MHVLGCKRRQYKKKGEVGTVSVQNTQSASIVCPLCQRKYKTQEIMENHLKEHGKGTQYKCEICALEYSKKDKLDRHMREGHALEKAFSCLVCGCKFTRMDNLAKHIKSNSCKNLFS